MCVFSPSDSLKQFFNHLIGPFCSITLNCGLWLAFYALSTLIWLRDLRFQLQSFCPRRYCYAYLLVRAYYYTYLTLVLLRVYTSHWIIVPGGSFLLSTSNLQLSLPFSSYAPEWTWTLLSSPNARTHVRMRMHAGPWQETCMVEKGSRVPWVRTYVWVYVHAWVVLPATSGAGRQLESRKRRERKNGAGMFLAAGIRKWCIAQRKTNGFPV